MDRSVSKARSPSKKTRSLQASDASTYTEIVIESMRANCKSFSNGYSLLCSPVLVPQMVGGVLEAVSAVTENWSVKHRPALEAAVPPSEKQ